MALPYSITWYSVLETDFCCFFLRYFRMYLHAHVHPHARMRLYARIRLCSRNAERRTSRIRMLIHTGRISEA